jgi:hypothetical protein
MCVAHMSVNDPAWRQVLPLLTKVPVFVDPDIMPHMAVIFAGDHEESVRAKTEDLFG